MTTNPTTRLPRVGQRVTFITLSGDTRTAVVHCRTADRLGVCLRDGWMFLYLPFRAFHDGKARVSR